MKKTFWLVYVTMISTSLLAQEASPHSPYAQQDPNAQTLSSAPAGAAEAQPASPVLTTNALEAAATPAAAPASEKPAAKKPKPAARKTAAAAAALKTVPLVPGPAVVAANRVNLRGQAKLKSEILARLTNGEPVTVIEEVKLKRSGPEEPSVWAKIALPAKVHAWVHTSYLDPSTKTVVPQKLNLRAGPGENYSILGSLQHGDGVKEIETKGHWMAIEPPANAYAYMAAQYLTQEPAALAAVAPTEPATVAAPPAMAAAETQVPALTGGTVETNAPPSVGIAEPAAAAPALEEPPPPRIVQREGIVRYTASVQAPTMFELIGADSRKPIDFLYTTSTNLDLNRYKGLHIIVTGEEGLDERWKTTPIITIQRIQVIE
jgi:uncharacterized protein YgiM (DUF1202 family)